MSQNGQPARVTLQQVQALAADCNFELSGVVPAGPAPDYDRFLDWVHAGMAGEMRYLTDYRAEVRQDARNLLPSARSVICVARSYNDGRPQQVGRATRPAAISKYASRPDYHDSLRADLTRFVTVLQELFGPFEFKLCIDTAPLLERSYAREAGLGWIGKNTCLINQRYGSFVFLAEIVTPLEIEPSTRVPDRCGSCTRCIDACPTNALVPSGSGWSLDARLCISYLTIEKRGLLDMAEREAIGAHVFGCDICQDVCPWNRKAATSVAAALELPVDGDDLQTFASLTPEQFRDIYRTTPVWRTKHRGFLRNVAVAMGNSGDRKHIGPLQALAGSDDPVVAEHAEWALSRVSSER